MKNEQVWAVRDARQLTAMEKVILFAITSRGSNCFATAATICDDAGMGRTAFYKHRRTLIDMGILVEKERPGTTTTYTVDLDALKSLIPARVSHGDTRMGEPVPVRDTGGSAVPRDGGAYRHATPKEVNIKEGNYESSPSSPASQFTSTEVEVGANAADSKNSIKRTSHSAEDVQTLIDVAKSIGFTLSPDEASQIQILITESAPTLSREQAMAVVRTYLSRRALPRDDEQYARSVGLLRWMLKDAKTPRGRRDDLPVMPDPRTASHATGGRRVSQM